MCLNIILQFFLLLGSHCISELGGCLMGQLVGYKSPKQIAFRICFSILHLPLVVNLLTSISPLSQTTLMSVPTPYDFQVVAYDV